MVIARKISSDEKLSNDAEFFKRAVMDFKQDTAKTNKNALLFNFNGKNDTKLRVAVFF